MEGAAAASSGFDDSTKVKKFLGGVNKYWSHMKDLWLRPNRMEVRQLNVFVNNDTLL